MTVNAAMPSDSTPKQLVARMLESENIENNNLINILGNIRPSRPSASGTSFTSIIRGLCTKNGKLITLLTNSLAEITNNDDENVMEIFKSFVNDFILWLDNGGLVLFDKYFLCLQDLANPNIVTPEIDGFSTLKFEQFGKPILNCLSYVNFIKSASKLLRNPFVLDKLEKTRLSLSQTIENYHLFNKLRELNNIEFNNIKTFGNTGHASTSSSPSNSDKVSSYFNLKQVKERSENELFYLVDHKSMKSQIEFVLLDLNKPENDGSCNSLAILSISPTREISRSLMYPPFRVNELSITLENSSIILKPMVFSTASSFNRSVHPPRLCITSPNGSLVTLWFKKLLTIFPQENSETMLIKATNQPAMMSGLGINIVTGSEHRRLVENQADDDDLIFETPLSSSKSNTFNELIASPSLSNSPLTQLQTQFRTSSSGSKSSTPRTETKLPPPQFAPPNRQNSSTSSLHSSASSFESARSQQIDRSINILQKTLTNTSLKSIGNTVEVFDPQRPNVSSRKSSVPEIKPSGSEFVSHANISHSSQNGSRASIHTNTQDLAAPQLPSSARSRISSQSATVTAQFPTIAPPSYSRTEIGTNTYMSPGFYDDYTRPRSSQGQISFIGDTPERDIDAINNDEIHLNDDINVDDDIDIDDEDANKDDTSDKSVLKHANSSQLESALPGKKGFTSVPDLSEKNAAFGSVPDLSTKQKPTLYQLSTGSGFDLQNFGKNHNPSFSIEKGLSDILHETPTGKSLKNSKSKTKSFFSIFKKGAKKPPPSPHLPQSPNSSIENLHRQEALDAPVMRNASQATVASYPVKVAANEQAPPRLTVSANSSDPVNAQLKVNAAGATHKPTPINTSAGSTKAISTPPSGGSAESRATSSRLPSPTTDRVSPTGSAFALPSSTSTYFFRPEASVPSKEVALEIPQHLKDVINDDSSVDFYLSNSSPKNIIVSKWKSNYGKWEMLTVNERLFVKIVVNYDLNKSWLLVFKEDFDEEYKEDVDMPVLILDLELGKSSVRQSTALDLQISATNSITNEKALTMIRCKTGALSSEIFNIINNVLNLLGKTGESRAIVYKSTSDQVLFSDTTSTSVMDMTDKTSSTPTSLSSPVNKKMQSSAPSNYSLNTIEANNAQLLNNPDNEKLLVLDSFPVRLQKQLPGSTPLINEAASWKVLSMYSTTIFLIRDSFTHKNYYNMVLRSMSGNPDAIEYSWLLADEEKLNRLERIGKAGLRIKVDPENCFMLECKGKKELKKLYDTLV